MADKILEDQRKSCKEEIVKLVDDTLVNLAESMQRIGIDKHGNTDIWFNVVKREVQNLMQQLITESDDRERVALTECKRLLKQTDKLCKILRIPMEPHGQDEGTCLIEQKMLLENRLGKYQVLIQEKRKEIRKLHKRNISVSKALNEDPIQIDDEIIPTVKEFQDIMDQLEEREQKRYEREEEFLKSREEILKILEELEFTPITDFEIIVTESSIAEFILSEQNMKMLGEFYASLMRLKVRFMWELLAEDAQNRKDFTQLHPGSSKNTLDAYINELHRCEELHKGNIGKLVERLRCAISDMWNKCHFSDEERDAFIYFKDAFYNEDLLEVHDREFDRLEQLYNDNKDMFVQLEDHEKFWKKVMELEKENTSPSRFFNRGAALLKEEKQRKLAQQKMAKIDAALVDLADNYEQLNGKPFRSYGRIIKDIIAEKHVTLEQMKKDTATDRKQKNADLTTDKPCSSRNLVQQSMRFAPDAKSTVKCRILSPKNATTWKKTRVLTAEKRAKIPIRKMTHASKTRFSLEKCRRLSDLIKEKGEEAYKEYTVQLCKSGLRSSLLKSGEELAVPIPKTPPNPSRCKSPCTTPRNKSPC